MMNIMKTSKPNNMYKANHYHYTKSRTMINKNKACDRCCKAARGEKKKRRKERKKSGAGLVETICALAAVQN